MSFYGRQLTLFSKDAVLIDKSDRRVAFGTLLLYSTNPQDLPKISLPITGKLSIGDNTFHKIKTYLRDLIIISQKYDEKVDFTDCLNYIRSFAPGLNTVIDDSFILRENDETG